MIYDITYSLEIMPYVITAFIFLLSVFLKLKYRSEGYSTITCSHPEAVRSLEVPIGKGYRYTIENSSSDAEVFIRHIAKELFRVYVLYGNVPIRLKEDEYGRYFSVYTDNASAIENVLEQICE